LKKEESLYKKLLELVIFITITFTIIYMTQLSKNSIFNISEISAFIIYFILILDMYILKSKIKDNIYLKRLLKKSLKFILIFLIFESANLFSYIPVYLFKLDVTNLSTSYQVLISCFDELMVMIILALLYWKDLKKEFYIFKKNIEENLNTGFIYYLLGLTIMFISNCIFIFILNMQQAQNQQAVSSMITYSPVIMLLEAGMLAPIVEEIMFRKATRDISNNKYIYVLFSGFLFGLMHVISLSSSLIDFLYIIPYGALGLVFALMDYKTNTTYTSIIFHMLHNSGLIILSMLLM